MFAESALTGEVQQHRAIRSKFLAQPRDVWVWLPPGYEEDTGTRYPVLYMHDGNNLFDDSGAFGGKAWNAHEAAQRLIQSGRVEPLIIVGVANSADRMEEYTWVPHVVNGEKMGGAGASYARFLVEELKPDIDRVYRTKPDAASTGVCGSSLGGLMSLYLAIFHWDTFERIGIVSPSLYWGQSAAVQHAKRLPRHLRIWLDIGWDEDGYGVLPPVVADTRELKTLLEAKDYKEGRNFWYAEDLYGEHNEHAWAKRLPRILSFLFGDRKERPGPVGL